MSDEVALRANDIVAGYGSGRVLQGLSFEVQHGRITAIIGANGAGKTTALRVVAGTLGFSEGSLELYGKRLPAHKLGRIREQVAMAPEGRRLFAAMTVEENLLLGAFTRRRSRAAVRESLEEVYERIPLLQERRRSNAGELSGGQQSLVAIARALMRSPRILLLDEPTLGLSPKACQDIIHQLRTLQKAGMTTVLVEQNASVALEVADTVHMIAAGRVVAAGPASEFRDSEKLAASYFSASSEGSSEEETASGDPSVSATSPVRGDTP